MSVVHVLDRVENGRGRCVSALAVAAAQHRAGWDVRLLVSGVRSPDLLSGRPVHEPLLGDLGDDVYRSVPDIDRVAAALERTTAPGDTIVAHDAIHLAAGCRLAARRVVGAVHSDPRDCLAYLPPGDLDRIVRRTDGWVAWGSAVAWQLVAALHVDPARITVSGQSVDPCRHGVRRMRGTPACLTVARIHPVKNHELVLGALALLAPALPRVHWHMVGGTDDAELAALLRGRAAELGVTGRVTWHGYRKDVASVMRGCDVLVLASHSEGVPRAVQEAMVLGVPTVMPAALAGDLSHAGLPVTYDESRPEVLAGAVGAALRAESRQLAAAASWVARRWGWPAVLRDWERAVDAR